MSLYEIKVDWRQVKTYATEANLRKRLEEDADLYPEHKDRYLVMRTPEGRWTAVVLLDVESGGYVGRYEFLKV